MGITAHGSDRATYEAPDEMLWIEMSNTDANRVICQTPILDVVTSDHKPVKIDYQNGDAYIKFAIVRNKRSGKRKYHTEYTELFIVCEGNDIHSVMAIPKKMSSRTIRLAPSPSVQLSPRLV